MYPRKVLTKCSLSKYLKYFKSPLPSPKKKNNPYSNINTIILITYSQAKQSRKFEPELLSFPKSYLFLIRILAVNKNNPGNPFFPHPLLLCSLYFGAAPVKEINLLKRLTRGCQSVACLCPMQYSVAAVVITCRGGSRPLKPERKFAIFRNSKTS